MGKGNRVKAKRRESKEMISSDPRAMLHAALSARAWTYWDVTPWREGMFTDWVPYESWWVYPASLVDGDEACKVDNIGPAMVFVDPHGIELSFAGRDGDTCERHESPPLQVYPFSQQGVTDLLAAVEAAERHVVNGAELLSCADGPGGCCGDEPRL